MTKCAGTLAVAVAIAMALACGCSSAPTPPINPQDTIQSKSPDDMPPTGTSGLGTPGGQEDAGIPPIPLDASIPPGDGQAAPH